MEENRIVTCPSCNGKLKLPYLPGKKVKIHCSKCGYTFETIFAEQKKKANYLDAIVSQIKRWWNSARYLYFKYKNDPIYREAIKKNGTLTIIIIAVLFILNLLLRAIR